MTHVHVRMHARGIGLEIHGDEAFYDRLLAGVLRPLVQDRAVARAGAASQTVRVAAAASPDPEPPGYRPPSAHFGVFQRQLDRSHGDDAERVAAFAFFLWNYEKKESFREEEVNGCFHADGAAPPDDPARVYGDLLTRRVLAPGERQGYWRLTTKGRDYVRHHLLSA